MNTEIARFIKVNKAQYFKLVNLLKLVNIPDEQESTPLKGLNKKMLSEAIISAVAICHDTRSLEGKCNNDITRGWDYLVNRVIKAQKENHLFNPLTLKNIKKSEFLGFITDDLGNIPKITDIYGRISLLKDLGERLEEMQLFKKSENNNGLIHLSIGGKSGLLNQLSTIKAYEDPVKKKSYFFLSLMANQGIWKYADPENLGPPVDYHEIRGHLRLGTIEIVDPNLIKKIRKNLEISPEEDFFIRKSIHDIIMDASIESNQSASKLHYFFWNMFRNCCDRYQPGCLNCNEFNCTVVHDLPKVYKDLCQETRCIFSTICITASRMKNSLLQEPNITTSFY